MNQKFGGCYLAHSFNVKDHCREVMYQSMCKFWWGEGSGEENGFHIWPRIEDIEVVKG